jgi:Flp pilus assembly protein CpaB
MAAVLPQGMRAISVAITAETGAGGFILPNDRVDVLMTYKTAADSSNQQRSVSETVLMNVRVLAIDQMFQTNDKGQRALGDDGPRLAARFAKGGRGGEVTLYRYGVQRTTNLSK